MFSIIEDDFEHPVGHLDFSGGKVGEEVRTMSLGVQQRNSVAIADAFDVAICCAAWIVGATSIAFTGMGPIESVTVFMFVVVQDHVAFVIAGFAEQPTEDPGWIVWVRDTRVDILAVERQDVVLRQRSPVNIAIVSPCPAFDSSEQTFDARPVAFNGITSRCLITMSRPVCGQDWYQIFRAGQDEDIGLTGIVIFWQALVCLAGNGWQRQSPAKAKRPVPCT